MIDTRITIPPDSNYPGLPVRDAGGHLQVWQSCKNPLERLDAEIKRRTNVVGIFPNNASIVRLVGAMMLEQNRRVAAEPALHAT